MASARMAFVLEAELLLQPDVDPAAVGAAVTTELCGHWEHEGPCRWPHNSAINPQGDYFAFRTLYVAPKCDELEVRSRIEAALRGDSRWRVVVCRSRQPAADERDLATRLART
jgi:hypothetical protein